MSFPSLLKDRRGESAVEFALVVPLLLLLLFAIIDGGRFLWEVNRAEKAAQAGVRFAVVSSPLAGGLITADYLGVDGLTQGDVIPKSELGKITCNQSACCVPTTICTNPYPALGTFNQTMFDAIYDRMHMLDPAIQKSNVTVSYGGSGLGFAGDPSGPQISPIVTVTVTGLTFQPITTMLFANVNLPQATATLTAEDLSGTQSN